MRQWMLVFFLAVGVIGTLFLPGGATQAPALPAPKLTMPANDLPPGRSFFRLHNEQNGLSQKSIVAIAQDRQGYIWIGSDDGAAYYNGRTWTTVNMPNPQVSNEVRAICPSQDGSIWFARGAGGLARLYQNRWTSFDETNSKLPKGSILALHETVSPTGTPILWVALETGLACYTNGHWFVEDSPTSDFSKTTILCFLETVASNGKHTLWAGTNAGLFYLDLEQPGVPGDSKRWATHAGPQAELLKKEVYALAEQTLPGGERFLWVGRDQDLIAFAFERSATRPLPDCLTRFPLQSSPLPASIFSLLSSRSAQGTPILWVGTSGGLARIEGRTPSNSERAETIPFSPVPNPADLAAWTVLSDQNSNFPINGAACLLETVSGDRHTLWVGTAGNGVAAWEDGRWVTYDTASSGVPNNLVFGLAETVQPDGSSTYWFGTDENGLARYENGRWTLFNSQNSGVPKSINCLLGTKTPDGRPELWFGSKNYLIGRFDGSAWQFFNLLESPLSTRTVWDLLETFSVTGERTIWAAGGDKGTLRFRGNQWTLLAAEHPDLPQNEVRQLAQTRNRAGHPVIWMATSGSGLIRYEDIPAPGKAAVSVFTTANSGLPNNQVYSLLPSVSANGEPVLWVGTAAGVCRLNLNQIQEPGLVLSTESTPSIPDNTIFQIREDAQKRLYLFTNKGIVRLTPNGETSGFEVSTFTTEDGLPVNTCNGECSMVDRRGRIWVGTIRGAAVFDPAKRMEDRAAKPLVIEHAWLGGLPFRADRKDVLPHESLIGPGGDSLNGVSLAYHENRLVFEVSLLGAGKSSETRYRTQLVGLEEEPTAWKSDFKREYLSLPAGSYTFRVWGKDSAGNVSGPQEVSFVIRPAPWLTWWAFAVYALCATGLVYGGVRWRLNALRQRNELLEHSVVKRTEELSHKNQELDRKVEELAQKNTELARSREEILQSYQQAGRIFNALAEALPGSVLDDKYRLEEKIGSGGFGAVFRATHLTLKKSVAVKVFRPIQGNASTESLERFKREAVSTCRVNHPNAVAVIDSGVASTGVAYLVMELLNGCTLAQELKQSGRFTALRCAEVVLPICSVLAKAHAAGIVHRDIKPDNIFLHRTAEGEEVVKVVDFGIAKLLGEAQEAEMETLTATNHIVGTPVFMAPERLLCKPYDGISDVYSVGVLAYLMLTGKFPFFSQAGIGGIILQQMTLEPPPLRQFNPGLPEAVEAAILQALAKSPEHRPTPAEFARRLGQAVGLETPQAGLTDTGAAERFSASTADSQVTKEFTEAAQAETLGLPPAFVATLQIERRETPDSKPKAAFYQLETAQYVTATEEAETVQSPMPFQPVTNPTNSDASQTEENPLSDGV
ncbi:MAG: protein kinase [Blastocatellia bacterium]|nr:protein kinase [Blastocatellia bacterium]